MTEIILGPLTDFPENDGRVIAIGDFEVGIFRLGDDIVAWRNHCPHAAGPACQGKVFRKVDETVLGDRTSAGMVFGGAHHVICPWHGFEFDLRTGLHPGDSRYRLQPVALSVRDSQVFVTVPNASHAAD